MLIEPTKQECGMLIQDLNQKSKFKRNIQGEHESRSVSASPADASGSTCQPTVRLPYLYCLHVTVLQCAILNHSQSGTSSDLWLENKGFVVACGDWGDLVRDLTAGDLG